MPSVASVRTVRTYWEKEEEDPRNKIGEILEAHQGCCPHQCFLPVLQRDVEAHKLRREQNHRLQ